MMSDFLVMKFGGTSVSSLKGWQTIAAQVRRAQEDGLVPVVVCSALTGVSDQLQELVDSAALGVSPGPQLEAIYSRHLAMAHELGVSETVFKPTFHRLEQLAVGVSLLREGGAKVVARVLSRGELLSTLLGHAWLKKQGIEISWRDARTFMTTTGEGAGARRWLSADVPSLVDASLQEQLGGAVLTQGFIARDPSGGTALLGRGGSDTTASVLAARLQAVRCEIWTDVPGLFTADPRKIPGARLLRSVSMAEAQEIASAGAKVLHPRSLPPLRGTQIPMWIRYTPDPSVEGTKITEAGSGPHGVRALSIRGAVVAVSMETVGMWQEVGFLAKAFAVFHDLGLSVDSVSTSETTVTATLDSAANLVDEEVLTELVLRLSKVCRATVHTGLASISLVGKGIRSILHRLGPALEVFEEEQVHLLTQAANDLNLTVVVNEEAAVRLLQRLHALLFAHQKEDEQFGPTWSALFTPAEERGEEAVSPWWVGQERRLVKVAEQGTPLYVLHGPTVKRRAEQLVNLKNVSKAFYAMKANPHERVLLACKEAGLGFECVSIGELQHLEKVCGTAVLENTIYTPNFASQEEMRVACATKVLVNIDNLWPLLHWGELFAGREIMLRVDLGKGKGHHKKVRTAGARSKFGIRVDQLAEAREAAAACGAVIIGLQSHAGSGILDPMAWRDTAALFMSLAEDFSDVRVLDLGGGLGIPDRQGGKALDLLALDAALGAVRTANPSLELWLEPGRFVVAEAGVLLATVHQRKTKGPVNYLGVDAGMNTLIRPALYGSYHEVVGLVERRETEQTTVVGPICETGDVLARDRVLPVLTEGDVVLFSTTGAYGRSMSNTYNLRPLPEQRWLEQ